MQPCTAPLLTLPSISATGEEKYITPTSLQLFQSSLNLLRSSISECMAPESKKSQPAISPPWAEYGYSHHASVESQSAYWANTNLNHTQHLTAPYDHAGLGPVPRFEGTRHFDDVSDKKKKSKPANLFSLIRRPRPNEHSPPSQRHSHNNNHTYYHHHQQQQPPPQPQPPTSRPASLTPSLTSDPVRSAPAHMTTYRRSVSSTSSGSPTSAPSMSRARSANYTAQDMGNPWNPSVQGSPATGSRPRQSSPYPQAVSSWESPSRNRMAASASPPPSLRPREQGSISDPFDDASQFHLFVEATSGLAAEPAPTFTFSSPQSPPRMASSLFEAQPSRPVGQRPHSDLLPSSNSTQYFLADIANISGDESDPPPDEELPDYAQSQAEASAQRRKEAAARAAELESRWASSRRWPSS